MTDRHTASSRLLLFVLTLVAAGLAAPAAASAAESAEEAGAFESPKDKLAVLAPLVAPRVESGSVRIAPPRNPSQERTTLLEIARAAKETGLDARRLELWLELLVGHGREGLASLTDASAVEMAKQVQGSWSMVSRFMGREVSRVRTRMYNDVLELRDGYAKLRSLTVEAGTLDMGEAPDPERGNEFLLAAYGTITQEDVHGLEYGLAEGETGVLQVFEGEFIGINFPGIPPKGVTVTLESLWVRQGEVYRTVFFHHTWRGITEAIRHLLEPGDTQITSWANRFTLGYTNFDSVEIYERISRDVEIGDIDAFWKRASESPRLFDPAVHAVPTPRERLHPSSR